MAKTNKAKTLKLCQDINKKEGEGLRKTLIGMLNYKGDYILGQQALTKDWVRQHHSYEAIRKETKRISKWTIKIS